MAAARYDMTIEAGADWYVTMFLTVAGVAKDLTGYTARMQIREEQPGPVIKELVSGAEIQLGGSAGTIVLYLTNAQTTALRITHGVYDLIVTDTLNKRSALLYGDVNVRPAVTRWT